MRVEKRENISLLTGCCVSLLVMIAGVILPWFIFQHWNWFWKVLAGVVIGVLAAAGIGVVIAQIIKFILAYIFTTPAGRKHDAERMEQRRERERALAARTEEWALELYDLAERAADDLLSTRKRARQIGEEIASEGGFPLMQQVADRVRAIGKERSDWHTYAIQHVERWWDGISGWRA